MSKDNVVSMKPQEYKDGFRTSKKLSLKEEVQELITAVKGLQAIAKLHSNAILTSNKSFVDNFSNVEKDVEGVVSMINDLQYKMLAITDMMSIDKEKLDALVDKMRSDDYDRASAIDDVKNNLVDDDIVKEDSVIVISSTCSEEGRAIFRSKLRLNDPGVDKDFVKNALGKKKNDTFETKLDNVMHTIVILSVKKENSAT